MCRVCYTEKEYKHRTGLFTESKLDRALSHKISELPLVSIEEGDGLPTKICLGKVLTIESKLETLKALAQSSYKAYVVCICSNLYTNVKLC